MRILLAIDHSDFSKAALAAVQSHYRPADSEVMVLHVLDVLTAYAGMTPIGPNALERMFEDERKAAEALVNRAKQELIAAGFRVSTRFRSGDARRAILDTASERKADKIVLGSHGRGDFERFLLGSVSEAVARHASCTVEIVRLPVVEK